MWADGDNHAEWLYMLYTSYLSVWYLPEFAEEFIYWLTEHESVGKPYVGCPIDDMMGKVHMNDTWRLIHHIVSDHVCLSLT